MEMQKFDFNVSVSSIINRPAMFQVSSVKDIYLIILGYTMAGGDKSPIYAAFTNNFREFVNEKFAEDFSSKKDYNWPELIRLNSGGDTHSIKVFGDLFTKFVDLSKADIV